jgi:hypothetical protein
MGGSPSPEHRRAMTPVAALVAGVVRVSKKGTFYTSIHVEHRAVHDGDLAVDRRQALASPSFPPPLFPIRGLEWARGPRRLAEPVQLGFSFIIYSKCRCECYL